MWPLSHFFKSFGHSTVSRYNPFFTGGPKYLCICGASVLFHITMQGHQEGESHVQASSEVDKVESQECEDVANCLVYKLVRVEEDGTVVPATEDEVLQVESILEGDVGVESSKGAQGLESERKKLLAQLEFLDSVLKKVKDEEQEWTVYDGLDSFNGFVHTGTTDGGRIHEMHWHHGSVLSDSKLGARMEANVQMLDSPGDSGKKSQTSKEQQLPASTGELESPSSTNKHSWMSSTSKNVTGVKLNKKDGSGSSTKEVADKRQSDLLKGEVSLDSLSIRELHEAFRTTFGRQTSVKDKQWLKRRITMGLQSLHESNNVVLEDTRNSAVDGVALQARLETSCLAEQPLLVSGIKEAIGKGTPTVVEEGNSAPKFSDHKKRSRRGSHMSGSLDLVVLDNLGGTADSSANKSQLQASGEREGKRQRKPTKRYIEELEGTDARAGGRSSGAKDLDHGGLEIKSEVRAISDEFETESGHADLGVSGLKFTTGYRRHRGRPKKSSIAILKNISTGRAAQLVRKAISARASRHAAKGNVSRLRFRARTLDGQMMHRPCSTDLHHRATNIDQDLVPILYPDSNNMESVAVDPVLHLPEEYVEIVPTPKGGMRRKHHRPWTLKEVMKLVEGVARCGVGKWAEIKKLAFSNSAYRTSVDLKDKWRNLLRASDTHFQANKQGEQRRKHTAAPIPGPILVRVRELAALHTHSHGLNIESGVSRSGRTVHRRHLI